MLIRALDGSGTAVAFTDTVPAKTGERSEGIIVRDSRVICRGVEIPIEKGKWRSEV